MLDDRRMRTGWLFLVGIVFASSACGSDRDGTNDDSVTYGASCSELCVDAAQCSSPPSSQSCTSVCEDQRELFNQGAWNTFTACIAEDSCTSIEDCMHEAAEAAPQASVDEFLGTVCNWATRCAATAVPQSQCMEMLRDFGAGDAAANSSSPWDALRVIKTSAMDCMVACVDALSCGELDFGKAASDCGQQCGFESAPDESDTSEACVAAHGSCGDNGVMIASEAGSCECQCDTGFVSSDYRCVLGS